MEIYADDMTFFLDPSDSNLRNVISVLMNQAVWLCIIGWLSMGLFGAQNILHHTDAAAGGLGIYITVIFSFPLYEVRDF